MTDTESESRARYAAFVRQNRVFILGAGFSAAAGIPMTNTLLATAMDMFSRESPSLFERVEGYAREAFGVSADRSTRVDFTMVSFADLCTFIEYIELREYGGGERWNNSGCREKLALKFFLSKAIMASTPATSEIPELYLDFARQLRPTDIVVSFNWDCLLESALVRVGAEFQYPALTGQVDRAEPKLTLYKLHGSANWRLGLPKRGDSFEWKGLGFTTGMMAEDVYFANGAIDPVVWAFARPLGELEPLIVLPGAGKAFDARHLAPIWYKPENAFALTHDIFIVGLSLAEDDFFIRSFFLSNLPFVESYSGIPGRRICVINPDHSVKRNYGFLDQVSNVEFMFEPFSSLHIALFGSNPGYRRDAG